MTILDPAQPFRALHRVVDRSVEGVTINLHCLNCDSKVSVEFPTANNLEAIRTWRRFHPHLTDRTAAAG